MAAQVRTGGKGSVRRKKKAIHKTTTTDDKRLQNTLKRLGVNNIPAIEEVNLFKDNGTVIHFTNPKGAFVPCAGLWRLRTCQWFCARLGCWCCRSGLLRRLFVPSAMHGLTFFASLAVAVQASIAANTYVVSGHAENKSALLPQPKRLGRGGPQGRALGNGEEDGR